MAEYTEGYLIGRANEGFYANDPTDAGGRTYAGISEKNNPTWAGWGIINTHEPLKHGDKIDDLELDSLIKQFYKANYWDKICGDLITDQNLANYIYDWFINSGRPAIDHLQELVNIDPQTGHFGQITLAAVNSADGGLLAKYHAARLQFYADIVSNHSEQGKFLKGWNSRAVTLYEKLTA